MKRLLIITAAAAVLALSIPTSVLDAQPTQAQFDALKLQVTQKAVQIDSLVARLALIEKAVNLFGDAGFMGPQIACSDLEAHRPPGDREFPNGEYNIPFRQKQLGCGVNDIWANLDYRMTQLTTKLPPAGRTVPEYVNSAIAALPPRTTQVDTVRFTVSGAPVGGGNGPDGSVYQFPQGMLQWRSNSRHLPSQSGITDEYCGQDQLNGYDGGHRFSQNTKDNDFVTLCVNRLPSTTFGVNSHGGWEYQWNPAGDGSTADRWPLDAATAPFYAGQTVLIDGGSQLPYTYNGLGGALTQRRFLFIASQRKGWPIYFGVSPNRTAGPENWAVARFNSDGSANPIEIVIENALRRLKSCNIGGQTVVCF